MKRTRILLLCAALLICAVALPSSALSGDADADLSQDITGSCTIALPERAAGYLSNLTDSSAATYVELKLGESITVTLPEETQGVVLEWHALPEAYQLTVRDGTDAVLSDEAVTPAFLNMYHGLPAGAASFTVSATAACALSTVAVFSAGTLPDTVQRWTLPEAGPDVLIVAAYPGDVLECFGGLYPHLLANGVDVNILYLSWRTRRRAQEALSALWEMGQTVYPYCMGFADRGANDVSSVTVDWGKAQANASVALMLQELRPDVIVTHAAAGDSEQDLAATSVTSSIVTDAVSRAAAAKENAFTPQKVYLHGAGDAATVLTYDEPLWRFDGKTAAEEAESLFSAFALTRQYLRELTKDNSYTLVQSAVGEDTAANDLMEHIEYAPLFTPEPSPTPTPSPTPSPTPTQAPSPTPSATAEPADASALPPIAGGLSGSRLVCGVILCAGLLLTLVLLCLFGVLKRKKGTAAALLIALAPLLAAGIVCGTLAGVSAMTGGLLPVAAVSADTPEPTEELTQTPTAAPTETPTPAPTEEPTPEPTEEPAASGAFDDKFLPADSEEAEIFSADDENGVWYYRSPVLAIEIERHQSDDPLVWFVAHIYLRDMDSFRSVIASPNYSGMFSMIPWKLARQNRAVLLITGDNLLNMDRDLKGILIRQGKVFLRTESRESCMAFFPETLSMKTYEKGTVSVSELLQSGVNDAFSFGPVLVSGGERGTRISINRLYKDNPRTGVGMIEPGHFVAIVVDGRRPEYSRGITLDEFADMFVAEGCVEAYNLDGGVSAAMIFMGEQLNHHGDKADWSKQRGLPDGLVWGYSNAVPTVDDPVYNTGSDSN